MLTVSRIDCALLQRPLLWLPHCISASRREEFVAALVRLAPHDRHIVHVRVSRSGKITSTTSMPFDKSVLLQVGRLAIINAGAEDCANEV